MTVASLNTEAHSAKLKPIAQHAPVQKWQAELDFLQKETIFYKKLLRMGLNNGQSSKKQLIFNLLEAFSRYEDVFLPEMQGDLHVFSAKSGDPGQDTLAYQKKMEHHKVALMDMKAKAFLLVSEFQKITVW